MNDDLYTLVVLIITAMSFAFGYYRGEIRGYKNGIEISMEALVNLGIISDVKVEIEEGEIE